MTEMLPSVESVETHVLDKRTRMMYSNVEPVGTRIAEVKVRLPFGRNFNPQDEYINRHNAEKLARNEAVGAWAAKWGDINWDMVNSTVGHSTFDVIYTFWVSER